MESYASHQREYIDQNIELQKRYDLQTQFAELIDGTMRTDFELRFNKHDLISEDGRSLDKTTSDAYEEAVRVATLKPELQFGIRRTKLERQEFHELITMAQGGGPNTKIVISDFPAELKNAPCDIGGYNISRQQTMLRVLVRKPNGHIQMYSRSLDGSNREALEAIYAHFNRQPEPGELLGQRIDVDLPWDERSVLVDFLAGMYDRSLSKQLGGEWYGGRPLANIRNTYDFVCRQTDVIEECLRLDKYGWLNVNVMYKFAAAINKRFERSQDYSTIISNYDTSQPTIDMDSVRHAFYEEIEAAGFEAQALGRTFSACGVTLEAANRNQFEQAGYGKKDTEDCEFTSKECPLCHTKNVKTRVTKTNITGSCGCSKQR